MYPSRTLIWPEAVEFQRFLRGHDVLSFLLLTGGCVARVGCVSETPSGFSLRVLAINWSLISSRSLGGRVYW